VFPVSTNNRRPQHLSPTPIVTAILTLGVYGGSWKPPTGSHFTSRNNANLISARFWFFNVTKRRGHQQYSPSVAQIATERKISGTTVTDNHGTPVTGVRPFGQRHRQRHPPNLAGATTTGHQTAFYSFKVFPRRLDRRRSRITILTSRGYQPVSNQSTTISGNQQPGGQFCRPANSQHPADPSASRVWSSGPIPFPTQTDCPGGATASTPSTKLPPPGFTLGTTHPPLAATFIFSDTRILRPSRTASIGGVLLPLNNRHSPDKQGVTRAGLRAPDFPAQFLPNPRLLRLTSRKSVPRLINLVTRLI